MMSLGVLVMQVFDIWSLPIDSDTTTDAAAESSIIICRCSPPAGLQVAASPPLASVTATCCAVPLAARCALALRERRTSPAARRTWRAMASDEARTPATQAATSALAADEKASDFMRRAARLTPSSSLLSPVGADQRRRRARRRAVRGVGSPSLVALAEPPRARARACVRQPG